MISLTVAPEDDETDLLGKDAGDLQSDIDVTESRISGVLKYVTGYTGFSGNTELQSGNYLALKFEATAGATTTVQLIGAVVNPNPVELDQDMNIVLRIVDPQTQKIKVVSELDDYQTVERVYTLTGLTLEEASA